MNTVQELRNKVFGGKGGSRPIKVEDVPEIHHQFMTIYGTFQMSIKVMLTLLPFVRKECNKKEQVRLCLLKMSGVKNPK